MSQYARSGVFPDKNSWKRTYKDMVKYHEEGMWYSRVSSDEFAQFRSIHPVYRESIIWVLCKYDPSIREHCQNFMQLICRLHSYEFEKLCHKCGSMFTNDAEHCLFRCAYLEDIRTRFKHLLATWFGSAVLELLNSFPNEIYIGVLLGSPDDTLDFLLNDSYIRFLKAGVSHISKLWCNFVH